MSGINYYPSREPDKTQRIVLLQYATSTAHSILATNANCLHLCSFNLSQITITSNENDKIPVGSSFDFVRAASDNVIFQWPGNGVYLNSAVGVSPKIREQNGACTLIKIDIGQWVIVGDIVAS